MDDQKQYIYFCGSNAELEAAIESYFQDLSNEIINYEVVFIQDEEEFLISISKKHPSIFIVDYCNFEESKFSPSLLKTIHGHSAFSQSPIAAVLNSESQCKEFEYFFGCGFSIFHVLGNDIKQFLNNLFYINYEIEPNNSKYALAKGFELDFDISSIGFVSHLDNVSLNIDTDINFGSEAPIKTNFTEDFPLLNYPIIESFTEGKNNLSFYHERVQIPFASGWDTEDENALFQDTHESWLETYKENFIHGAIDILYYSKSLDSIRMVNKFSNSDVNINFNYTYDESKKDLYKCKPDLVIFEITDEDSHKELHNLLSDISFNPSFSNTYFLIFNHTAHTNAIRKMYEFDNIIATKSAPAFKILDQMISSLKEKVSKDGFQFKSSDPKKIVYYNLPVKITSITENEITFKTKLEIPCYSILKVDTPITMYLIIIPSKLDLSPFPDGYHYQCLICGIDTHSSEYLRKYVNKLLGKTPESWIHIDFSSNSTNEKKVEEEIIAEKTSKKEKEVKQANIIDPSKVNFGERSKSKNLKSKL